MTQTSPQPALYHLSHTDLDGYTCQYLAAHCFERHMFANSNYGNEILVQTYSLIETMRRDAAPSILLLISDLNLSPQQCESIETALGDLRKALPESTVSLQLLDHHASGRNSAETFGWYYLDTARSASKIVYDYLVREHDCGETLDTCRTLVEAVNAIDIWLSDMPLFEYGKVIMGAVASAREINRILFDTQEREYRFFIIDEARKRMHLPKAPIALDDAVHFIKKAYFGAGRPENTLDNLVADYVTELLTRQKEHLAIRFEEARGVLTYGLVNISVVGNAFLVANPEIDFILNVSPSGSISLRSADRVDVSKIAARLAGGGGHPNASGGRLKDFKEAFTYEQVKLFINELINMIIAKES